MAWGLRREWSPQVEAVGLEHSRHRLDLLGTTSNRGPEQFHSTENIVAMCWPSAASSCADLVDRHQKWQGGRHGILPVGPSMLGIARKYGRCLQLPQGRCSARHHQVVTILPWVSGICECARREYVQRAPDRTSSKSRICMSETKIT